MRAALETAAYALILFAETEATSIWINRHDDEKSKSRCRNFFTHGRMLAAVRAKNAKAAEVFAKMYDTAVDLGAHPNERAITGNLDIVDVTGGQEWRQISLHGDGIQLDLALKNCARVGVCLLEIFQEIFTGRFELLGVRYEILTLRQGI